MRWLSLTGLFLLTGALLAGSPADAVAAAWKDARSLPKSEVRHCRYLSLHGVPEREREQFLKALAFHVNTLSREATLVPPGMGGWTLLGNVVRVSLVDYGWNEKVWDKLADVDPWFHYLDPRVTRKVEVKVQGAADRIDRAIGAVESAVLPPTQGQLFRERPGGALERIGRGQVKSGDVIYEEPSPGAPLRKLSAAPAPQGPGQAPRREEKGELVPEQIGKPPVIAPWYDKVQWLELEDLTGSRAPVVRADWFLFWTSQSVDRGGAGYYDFLGLKSLKDAQALAGLDIEKARVARREIAGLIRRSGVATNSRQVLWFRTVAGSWWQTDDSAKAQGKANALRLLDGDFVPDANEVYFTLPNYLFGLVAANPKNGQLQQVVPPEIASDRRSPNNDLRIHAGLSCVRCHSEGLRPFEEWARATFDGPAGLGAVDKETFKRLQQLYFSDLPRQLKRDNEEYAEALRKLNGLTPAENATTYAEAFAAYFDRDLDLDALVGDYGFDPKVFRKALEAYSKEPGADLILVGLLARKPQSLRREHAEELHALAQKIYRSGGGK